MQSLLPQTKKTPHSITVSGDRDIVMSSYPGALSQILTNLVMNSFTHAFPDDVEGKIRIHVRQSGRKAQLEYSDNGKGAPAEVLKHIFDPFYTTNRGSGGSGLGMHIVYNLVSKKLGGAVTCESAPGQGIAIRITMPLDPETNA